MRRVAQDGGPNFPRALSSGAPFSNHTQPLSSHRPTSHSASLTSSRPPLSASPTSPVPPSRTASATTTTSAAPRTVGNGEVVTDATAGMIIAAGVGGAYLLIAGQYFSMAAGSVAQVGAGAGGLASGLTSLSGPEPQEVDQPGDESENSQPTATGEEKSQEQLTTSDPALSLTSTGFSSFTSTSSSSFWSTSSSSFTSTSSSASATSSSMPIYIVVPDSAGTAAELESIKSSLSTSAGDSLVSVADEEDNSVLFYEAPLSPEAAKELEGQQGVAAVSEDTLFGEMKDFLAEPAAEAGDEAGPSEPPPASAKDPLSVAKQPQKVARQEGYGPNNDVKEINHLEARDLAYISQEPGRWLTTAFAYDEDAGSGITVYILGTGLNLESPDIKDAVGTKDFIFTPGAAETKTDEDTDISLADGTCMASKIFGPHFGVAKKANVVMVKLSGRRNMFGAIHLSEMLTALAMVKNDIHKRGLEGKAVVSLTYTTPLGDPQTIAAYKEILEKMMEDDIVLVASTGISNNNGGSKKNDQYPGAFSKDTNLITISAVNMRGEQMDWSPGTPQDGVTVAAPGLGYCAYKAFNPKDRATPRAQQDLTRLVRSEGFAAATVAGVAAGLMSQAEYGTQIHVKGRVAANVKQLLSDLAWVRAEGGPPVVWNGVLTSSGLCRRQDGDSCSAAPSATPTAVPSAASSATPAAGQTEPPAKARPPKPLYDDIPATWTKQYEGDVNYSFDYTTSSSSTSGGFNGDPLAWCLGLCNDGCKSVFLTRVNQDLGSRYNTYFICNQYDRVWSNDFIQELSSSSYDAGIALDKQ
ncbi:Subtilisin-like protease 9 [Colletotrichum orbiculare MAFF 240422]|uniref:Subtilisin-like protease 9 n=1 Tax=Colletotrichum orbiculare (strain 104-T / ATCC 96160 / CBS 514.97 / LARS 414 / MAFF 240422) TaxID=1213857 RepID=A0A484FMV5_COLOR|nr:Subtilisin-like protease 9 [Colletotrichum orbiculare MAFF 240422]